MNIIRIDHNWLKKALAVPFTPSQKSTLLNKYGLKDFRLVAPDGDNIDLWLDELDLGDYGTHSAICVKTPLDSEGEWDAILCSDTELAQNFYKAGFVIRKKGTETIISQTEKNVLSVAGLWFLVNREILKKYKIVIKMGKRRHLIQELGEKRADINEQKPIKIANGISYIWEYENPRSFNRHCEAWGVRGHYRHYKSGKVVFIQPYVKGSGRLKDSLYEL